MRVEGDEEDEVDEQMLVHTPTRYYLRARTCTHQQLSSRHPTPAAVAIYTGQGLHTSSGNAIGTRATYGSLPYNTTYHIRTPTRPLSHVDLIALRQ